LGKIAAGASYMDGIIYIVGGYHVLDNGSEISSKLVHRFDCESNIFLSDATELPIAIDDHVQAVWRDSLLYVITGWSNNGNRALVQVYNPNSNTWEFQFQQWNNALYSSFGASGTIIDDTIIYLGGSRSGSSFTLQTQLRKGVIDPNTPLEINWSNKEIPVEQSLYRAASISFNNKALWLGGSNNTYNYDGVAYDGSGGVEPSFQTVKHVGDSLCNEQNNLLPMDLRGAAFFSKNGSAFLCGGMTANQTTSNKTLMLQSDLLSVELNPTHLNLTFWPNPANQKMTVANPSELIKAQITSAYGQILKSMAIKKGNTEIDLSMFPSGIYFITSADGQSHRLVIQH
jgi:N-acetylneuraminic acid mutarotase